MCSPSDDLSNQDRHHIRLNKTMRYNAHDNSKQCVHTRDCLSTEFHAAVVDCKSPPFLQFGQQHRVHPRANSQLQQQQQKADSDGDGHHMLRNIPVYFQVSASQKASSIRTGRDVRAGKVPDQWACSPVQKPVHLT